jgi:Adenylate and Guanylate cyclase catalytic domain
MIKYKYNSLEDYLRSHPLDVDGLLDDGFGAFFPVKGRLMDAAVLFADMSSFSSRSSELSPIETLILANNLFCWISAEGISSGRGIVDKYIGDEVMVVFSKEFGSEDPLADAISAGRWMAEKDYLGFGLHVGVAVGPVVVGYVGTPLRYNCSVYGTVVTLARRCCQIQSQAEASIILPAKAWAGRKLEEVLLKEKVGDPDGQQSYIDLPWELRPMRTETLKDGQELEVQEIARQGITLPPETPQQRARKAFEGLKGDGSYRPRRYTTAETPPEGFKP